MVRRFTVSLVLVVAGFVAGLVVTGRMRTAADSAADARPAAADPGQRAPLAPTSAGLGFTSGGPDFTRVAGQAVKGVANISSLQVIRTRNSPFANDPFFRYFFGDDEQFGSRDRRSLSLGSGVIISADGYVVTNNHVVGENVREITIALPDKREIKGRVVGADPDTDIALLKIPVSGLPVVPWGDSGQLKVGEWVLAIGSPFQLSQTVTAGIVSATGRANMGFANYEDFIQTDAAINPGNSGGALVNARGELIGINTAIFSQSGGYMGIGFAVPSNMVRSVMEQLRKGGKVVRGYLGVSIQELTQDLAKQFGVSETKGVLISDVLSDSPARRARLERGDVLIEFDGRAVENPTQFRNLVAQTPIGKKVHVRLIRNGQTKELDVTIGEQPKTMAQAESPGDSNQEARSSGAFAGLDVRELTPELARRFNLSQDGQGGVVVARVADGSPAGEAGVQVGDVITEVNRKPIATLRDFQYVTDKLSPKDPALVLVHRNGRNLYLTIQP